MHTTISHAPGGRRDFEHGDITMSSTSLTFRCPECRKLLAASRSRIGTMVICPKCQCDLVVPVPSETVASSSGNNSGIDPSSGPVQVGVSTPYRDANAAAGVGGPAIFLPIQIEDDPLSLRPDAGARSHKIPDRSPIKESSSSPGASSDTLPTGASVPSAPPRAVESPRPGNTTALVRPEPAVREPVPRRSDVVMPRTAVVLWSFAMVLALIFTFLAGLLGGHFVWRLPEQPSPPASTAPESPPTEASRDAF